MKRLSLALGLVACMAAPILASSSADAASCRDAKGKFVACPPAAAAKKQPCRDARGKFVACTGGTAAPSHQD